MSLSTRVLLVDSYDSFTQNVGHLLASVGAMLDVVAVDDPRLSVRFVRNYEAIVLGPGPGAPHEGDALARVVAWSLAAKRPLLGVCLGLQAIAAYYGARVARGPRPMHGEVSAIAHDGSGLFTGLPSPLRGMRYHSLCVLRATVPNTLRANAFSEDGVIQGLHDPSRPVHAVQFHPESFLSEYGEALFVNFLGTVRLDRQMASPFGTHSAR